MIEIEQIEADAPVAGRRDLKLPAAMCEAPKCGLEERPGGRVAATVWDTFGGVPWIRLLWDTAAVLDPSAERPRALFSSLTAPGEMSAMWRQVGLIEIEQTSLTIRMDYANFDDYWRPLESRDGPPGLYLAALSDQARATLREHVRRGFLCNRPDGPRSFASTAWACRGTVPS